MGVIFGNPEITSGGNALKFYASVRLEVRRKETIKGPAGGDDVGIRVKAKVRRCACMPKRTKPSLILPARAALIAALQCRCQRHLSCEDVCRVVCARSDPCVYLVLGKHARETTANCPFQHNVIYTRCLSPSI